MFCVNSATDMSNCSSALSVDRIDHCWNAQNVVCVCKLEQNIVQNPICICMKYEDV